MRNSLSLYLLPTNYFPTLVGILIKYPPSKWGNPSINLPTKIVIRVSEFGIQKMQVGPTPSRYSLTWREIYSQWWSFVIAKLELKIEALHIFTV